MSIQNRDMLHVQDHGIAHDPGYETPEQQAAEDYQAVRVHVTNPVPTTTGATQYGAYETIDLPAGMPLPLLPRDPLRQYAYISPLDSGIVIGTTLEQLQGPNNLAVVQSSPVEPVNPAPGAGFSTTIQAPCQLNSVFFKLVTSAAVANRFASVRIADASGNPIVTIADGSAIVASTTVLFSLAQGMGSTLSGASGTNTGGLPNLTLQPGWTVSIFVTAEDAADQVSQIAMVFTNTGTGPSNPSGSYLPALATTPPIRHNEPVYGVSPVPCRVSVLVERGDVQ